MKKICIQPGHWKRTSGAIGAPGEQEWNLKIAGMITTILIERGADVYMADSFADKDTKVTGTDWDLFLSIHYDADIYNDRGGFVDVPEHDLVAKESRRIADIIRQEYFSKTGIPEKPNRSNDNTRNYYMWSALSGKTPCVIIECGVGWRKPEDYNTLRQYDKIAEILADAICISLSIPLEPDYSNYYDLDSDIPTKIENKHGLKEVKGYDKYCSFNDILADYVKTKKELEDLKNDTKKEYEENALLIKDLNKKIEVRNITIDSMNNAYKEKEEEWNIAKATYERAIDGLTKDLASKNTEIEEIKKAYGSNGWQLISLGLEKMLYNNKEKIKSLFEKLKGGEK